MGINMKREIVFKKLTYACRRLKDMQNLNAGNFVGASTSDKHQLTQEFFFHLIGAVDYTAQFVNSALELKITGIVNAKNVIDKLEATNKYPSVKNELKCIYVNLKENPTMPAKPYSHYGLVYRAYNYRHQVTHRGLYPFIYQPNTTRVSVSLELDPRNDSTMPSKSSLFKDLEDMFELFSIGCYKVIQLVEQSTSED